MRAKGMSLLQGMAALLLLVFSTLAPSATSQPTTDQRSVNALWVGETNGVLKVATADGKVLFEIPHAGDVRAVTVDARQGNVWAVADGKLTSYSPDGEVLLTAALPADDKRATKSGNGDQQHLALAVDTEDGAVWLAQQQSLYRLGADGQLASTVSLGSPVQSLAFDQTHRQLWVAAGRTLHAFDAAGKLVRTIAPAKQTPFTALAFDESLDALWAADAKGLSRYGTNGALQQQLSLPGVRALSADHQGGLWAATAKRLLSLDASGLVRFAFEPFQGRNGVLVALAADPGDRSAWVVSQHAVVHVGADGTVLHSLDFGQGAMPGRIWTLATLALFADTTPPELHFTAPAAEAWLKTNQPSLEFAYSDEGAGIDAETLTVEANGASLPITCSHRDTGATCTPSTPLPEGGVTLTATIKDRAGNASAPATVSFTVDTVAPVIQVSAPTNGAYTNQPQQTITGTVSEAASLTINGAAVTLGLQHAFQRTVALVEGLNTFTLTATDRAGNVASQFLSIVLETTSPAIPDSSLINIAARAGIAQITGLSGSVEAEARVTITNMRIGEQVTVTATADGSFSATIAAQAGDQLAIQVFDGAGNAGTALVRTVTSLDVRLTYPLAGASLSTDKVTVRGTYDAPVNTGITVNGVMALLDGQGHFIANAVPLLAGENLITATATSFEGSRVVDQVRITATGIANVLELRAAPEIGVLPLTVDFGHSFGGAGTIMRIRVDFDGNGTDDFSSTDPSAPIRHTYTTAGLYTATLTLTDDKGVDHRAEVAVGVQDAAALDTLLQSLWGGMTQALATGDKAGALQYLNAPARTKYGPAFDVLLPHMADILPSFSSPQRVNLYSSIGEYAINRSINGENHIYLIYFLQSPDGVWRLDSM